VRDASETSGDVSSRPELPQRLVRRLCRPAFCPPSARHPRIPDVKPDNARIEQIVDDLYAGVLDEDAWHRGLKSIARLVGGQGPFLLAFNPTTAAVLRDQTYDYDPALVQQFREQWSTKDIRLTALLEVPVGPAVTERMMIPTGEWERCEAYNEFFRVIDAPWLVTTWLHKSPDKVALFSVQATRDRGPFNEQDVACVETIVPHVRRALAIKDRIESDVLRSQSLLQAFERVPFGMMILDEKGCVLDASSAALQALQSTTVLRREPGGRFSFGGTTGHELHRLTTSAMRAGCLQDGQLHVSRGAGRSPLSLLLTPLPAKATAWLSSQPRWLLFVFDPEQGVDANAARIQADLIISPREAELASLLAAGLSLEVSSKRLRISIETARHHLKSIFAKTGTHSQAELVRRILSGPAVARSS
jgi:DNA-binding CsgD family transcriptional regulator